MPTSPDLQKKLYCFGLPEAVVRALAGLAVQNQWDVVPVEALHDLPKDTAETQQIAWLLPAHLAEEILAENVQKILLLPAGESSEQKGLSARLPIRARDFSLLLKSLDRPAILYGKGVLSVFGLDIVQKVLVRDGVESSVSLTDREMALVEFLLENPEGAARLQILHHVWGYSAEVETQTLETHVSRLRGKMAAIGLGLHAQAGCYTLQLRHASFGENGRCG